MNWYEAPLNEFIKIPWSEVTAGCHLTPDNKLMCWDYLPTNAFFKMVDAHEPMQKSSEWWMILAIVILAIHAAFMIFGKGETNET